MVKKVSIWERRGNRKERWGNRLEKLDCTLVMMVNNLGKWENTWEMTGNKTGR